MCIHSHYKDRRFMQNLILRPWMEEDVTHWHVWAPSTKRANSSIGYNTTQTDGAKKNNKILIHNLMVNYLFRQHRLRTQRQKTAFQWTLYWFAGGQQEDMYEDKKNAKLFMCAQALELLMYTKSPEIADVRVTLKYVSAIRRPTFIIILHLCPHQRQIRDFLTLFPT